MTRYKNGLGWGVATGVLSMLLTAAVAYGSEPQPVAPAPSSQPAPAVPSTTTPPGTTPSAPTTGRPIKAGRRKHADRKTPKVGIKAPVDGQRDQRVRDEKQETEQRLQDANQQIESSLQK